MEHLIDQDFEDFEDFEVETATYRVLLSVLTEDEDELQYHPLRDYTDPEEACIFADKKAEELCKLMNTGTYKLDGQEVLYAAITIETVVDLDGEEDYAGQIYNKPFYTKPVGN